MPGPCTRPAPAARSDTCRTSRGDKQATLGCRSKGRIVNVASIASPLMMPTSGRLPDAENGADGLASMMQETIGTSAEAIRCLEAS